MSEAYRKSGVDINAGYQTVERISKMANKTKIKGVMEGLGNFGALFDLSAYAIDQPVLVSGTDGVGTKLLVAQALHRYETIGIDCVAMCVNDVVAQGAKPLFFLDYLAVGKLDPTQAASVVSGVAEGCHQGQMALIGGETAEMPGLYSAEEFDLAGFCVGVAEKEKLLKKETIVPGDYLIGLPSSGIHSNGYSLVRHLLAEHGLSYDTAFEEQTLGDVLLTPTRIYVDDVLEPLEHGWIKGLAHITGGGFYENIPRMLPETVTASIKKGSWPVLPIFRYLQTLGELSDEEMFEIFNMGIGMVVCVAREHVEHLATYFKDKQLPFYEIGTIEAKQESALVLKEEL